MVRSIVLIWCVLGPACVTAAAQNTTPAPRDTPYAGTIALHVDATDVARRIFRVHESIPVAPGSLVLQYPKWLPGNHAPRGPIEQIAGPQIEANGKPLYWVRDPLDVYAFRVMVPRNVTRLEVELQFISPDTAEQGRITMTSEILGVQWEKMLLYPAGHYMSRIRFEPSVSLPSGWQYGTALDGARKDGDTVHFGAVPLDVLIDSPLFAGLYFKRVELDGNPKGPVHLDVVADSAAELEISDEALKAHRKLVAEATALFGSRHFDHYDFLFSISNNFGTIGLEHGRSSEDGVRTGYFREWENSITERYLLAHEMAHSWNGKFLRPADLWVPTLNVPMQDSLLWIYEGATQYWGHVLGVRSGLWSDEIARGAIAADAAALQELRPGRAWRNLEDTTNQPIISPRRPQSFVSWQRTEDYYQEGELIWLDVEGRLRERSGDRISLDDFARSFFGVNDGSFVPRTYTFADVVKALNDLVPDDWAGFLRARVDSHGPDAPLGGLKASGWRLVFKDKPSLFAKKAEELAATVNRTFSIGLTLNKEARLTQVVWESAAFKAGLTVSTTVVAVNGRTYTKALLDDAIREARDPAKPVELLVKDMDRYRTVKLGYSGGPRFPDLERIEGTPDRLAEIFKPRT